MSLAVWQQSPGGMQPTGGGRRRAKAFYGLMAQSKGRAFSSKFVERAKGLLGQGKGSYGVMSEGFGRGPTPSSAGVVPAFCGQACGKHCSTNVQPSIHAPSGMVLTKSSSTHKSTPLQNWVDRSPTVTWVAGMRASCKRPRGLQNSENRMRQRRTCVELAVCWPRCSMA